ncbi:MAG: outer membrane beta-barrel domain-containing protein [Gammaproteobacteria bacterium]|jgi:outer membrane beta-barrel protein
MESRFRILFLIVLLSGLSQISLAADSTSGPVDNKADQIVPQEQVIQPQVKRRVIKVQNIGTDNLELTAFTGLLSIEDFGTHPVYGLRLDYHVTEDVFFQGTLGQSKGGTTSYERLSAGVPLLTDNQRKYIYYNISIGYNLLPGEAFLGRDLAYNTALYVLAGAGSTKFAGNNHFTITVGGGYRVDVTDWFVVHLDVRDHIFSNDVTGVDKTTHNFATTLGLTYVF